MQNLPSDLTRVIVSEEDLQARVKEIAAQIDLDYAGVDHIYLIGILKGAYMFLADLARHLKTPHTVDFMAVSSYGKTATSGEVRLIMDVREPITEKHVLIVEDIVDSGNTLRYLIHMLEYRKPASLRSVAIVSKDRDNGAVPIDYVGFKIPNVWVVGYGLDYAERHRTLPYIAELNKEIYK